MIPASGISFRYSTTESTAPGRYATFERASNPGNGHPQGNGMHRPRVVSQNGASAVQSSSSEHEVKHPVSTSTHRSTGSQATHALPRANPRSQGSGQTASVQLTSDPWSHAHVLQDVGSGTEEAPDGYVVPSTRHAISSPPSDPASGTEPPSPAASPAEPPSGAPSRGGPPSDSSDRPVAGSQAIAAIRIAMQGEICRLATMKMGIR